MRSNSSRLDLSGVVSQMQEQLQLEMLLYGQLCGLITGIRIRELEHDMATPPRRDRSAHDWSSKRTRPEHTPDMLR